MKPIRVHRALASRPLSRVAAIFLLFALLGGAVEIHGHGASHEGDLGASARFTPEASHPNQSHHVEAGSEVDRPVCAACLHSLTARGLRLPRATALRAETGGVRLPAPPDLVSSDPCARWVGGRSPPQV